MRDVVPKNEIKQYFSKLIDQICWGAHRSIGSTITLHFGDKVKYHRSDGSEGYLGSWSIMIELADWSIIEKASNKVVLNSNMGSDSIDHSLSRSISNKPFKGVTINTDTLNTIFEIGELIISVNPYQNVSSGFERDIWTLYTPFEKAISLSTQGNYIFHLIPEPF